MSSITGVSVSDQSPDPDGRAPLESDQADSGRLGDKIFGGLAKGSGILVVALVTLIGVFLIAQAIPALSRNNANFLTSTEWNVANPDSMSFGIARLLWVTVISSLLALILAVPLGVCIALFITQYAPTWLARPAASLIDLLAAVPSIVYGLWGAYVVGQYFRPIQDFVTSVFGWIPLFADEGASAASTIAFVSIVLAVMILPIITALSREVFAQTPGTHKEAALALGATKWEMIRTAVLPFGKPGVISASMLGLGRALGETVAVMIIVSSLPEGAPWSWSIFNGGETFASKIANNYGEFDSPTKTGAYIAAGLVLFLLTFVVNAIARVVIERRKAFTE
ncbi:phosphate transport system permease protein [Barrientosiimonas humi]|uniref:Phosphate transport system permease protein n=1 Tax=Barrientosiimonas humi TaxID=999931 RepID=A0A542XF36_9MICO|nr:phosphate ABC transporter permease subunit PstC [Barrientosiimonas humi]TQL34441.1 phosphate transport system permease protein [Barrientosiimonas humi]CAG7574430.1 Phosphate transport system permease protein PstC 2 [Barrientosiimonas humi]